MSQFQPSRLSCTEPAARRDRRRPPIRALVRALAVAGVVSHLGLAGLPPAAAQALPSGLNVVHGQATAVVNGNQMTVTNSANAALNWQAFSVGAGQQVRFDQPSAASRVLNRVVGNDPSQIFGNISSNGQVWLLNPHGVLFGRDARVDVGSLVVSTLGMPLADWVKGQGTLSMTAMGGAGAAPVVNQGELRAASGGRVWLVGGDGGVRNEGLIAAPDGQVVLAAGHSVDLVDERLPHVAVRISAPGAEAVNLGSATAGGGRVDLLAAVVNQSGIVRADTIGAGSGVVTVQATESLRLAPGSVTSANGADGGRVLLDAGPAGTLSMAGSVQATGNAGRGGEVQLLGRHVGLTDAAVVDASGSTGGGQVFIGGGLQGKDASLRNAEAVYFGATASVRADATDNGDGGSIILWSDRATRAYGHLSARGGADGGDGGFIETSGGWLDARPASVDTTAPRGRAGQWLLDPNDLYIIDGGPDQNLSSSVIGSEVDYTTTNDYAIIDTSTIAAALNGGNNVTLSTGAQGTNNESGDIFMSGATIAVSPPSPVTLTLNALRDIELDNGSSISGAAGAGALSVVLSAGQNGIGAIRIWDSQISTPGGNIDLGGSSIPVGPNVPVAAPEGAVGDTGRAVGIDIRDSTLSAVGGRIDGRAFSVAQSLTGGSADAHGAMGVRIAGSTLSARDIDLFGWVDSDGDFRRVGVEITGSSVSATRTITIDGYAYSGVLHPVNGSNAIDGVDLGSGVSVSVLPPVPDPSAALTIIGTAVETQPMICCSSYILRNGVSSDATLTVGGNGTAEFVGYGSGGAVNAFELRGTLGFGAAAGASVYGVGYVLIGNAWIVAPTGGLLSLEGDTHVDLASSTISGSPSALEMVAGTRVLLRGSSVSLPGSADVDIEAPTVNFGYFDGFSDSPVTLNTGGAVTIRANTLEIRSGSSVTSQSSGDAIVIRGINGNVQTFNNLAGAGALSAPNGRWLVYASDPEDNVNFVLGDLPYDFRQYDADVNGPGATPLGDGNGILFNVTPMLALSGSVADVTKVYDGSTVIDLGAFGLVASGLLTGDVLAADAFNFADPNTGVGKVIDFGTGSGPGVVDALDKPVYGYALDSPGHEGDITPRLLTLATLVIANKVYNGNANAQLSSGSLLNLVAGETLGLTLVSGLFDTPNAGSGKPVAGVVALVDGTGLASNYDISDGGAFATTASITPRPLTLSGVIAANKVYDGNAATTLSGGSLGNLVVGQTLGLTLSGGLFSNANAGTGKLVTGTAGLVNGTGLAANYQLPGGGAVNATASITPRPLALSGVLAADKVYDGSRSASLSGGSLVNLVLGESLGLALSNGLFDTADAGSGKTVTGTAVLANGSGLASNYQLTSGAAINTTAAIGQRPLTITGVLAADKVYDGTLGATLSGGSLGNLVAGQTLGLSLSNGLFDTADAGTGKPVTGTAALVNGSGSALNYQLPAGGAVNTTASITPRPLTLSGVLAADKVYDGSRDATLSGGSLGNLVSNETLGLSLGGGLFDTPHAGSGKPVTGSATLANGTGLATNYRLDSGAINATAAISPRPVSLSGVVAADKVYDGTRVAALSGGNLANLVAGETLGVALPGGVFDTADAGTGKLVAGTAALVDGTGLATNYQLTSGALVSTTAAISPRPLTLSGVLAADKVYDGNRDAAVSGGSLDNLVAGQNLGLSLGVGQFDTANAGTAKAVTGSATLSNGTGVASNYQLTAGGAYSTTADITPRPLTLNGVVAADKVYDGTRDASLSGGSLGNLVAGQTLGLALGAGLFDNANAGTDKVVSGSATLSNGTGLASNYQLPAGGAFSTTADITPRPLALGGVLAADKVYDGTRDATLSGGSLGNLVAGQTLGLVLTDGLFDTANVGTGKAVTGTAALANGTGLASNYQLASGALVNTTAAISPRPLALSGVLAADKDYDGTRDAVLSGGSLGNLVAGQTLGLSLGMGQFDNANAGADKAVTGSATLSDGTGLASNYQLPAGGAFGTTADITPRPLTLSGVVAADKGYDGTRDATLSGGSLGNLVVGQSLGLTLADGLFDTANAGTGKPVTGTATLVDGSGLASNYTLGNAGTLATTASIEQRLLTLSGVVANDKTYDGTRDASFSGGSLGNLVAGQTLALALAGGLFDTAGAGGGKPVTGTATLVDGSGLASNYTLGSAAAVATTASIAQRLLTIDGVLAADKVYDGTRAASLSGGALGNLALGETLGLTLSGGLFDTARAGSNKPVVGTATLVDGSTGTAANYMLPDAGAVAATASISRRPLTLGNVLAADKVYDGTRDTVLSGGNLANLVAGETLALSYSTGLFDTAHAGAAKPVTGTAVLGDGTGLASDYLLPNGGAVASAAAISPRTVTLTGVAAADKVYDGTLTTTLLGGQLANLVNGETLGVVLSAGLFDTPNAGLDKAVTGTAALADGSGRVSNYRLASTSVASTADVAHAALQYVADPVTAVQGRLPPVLTGQVTGFVAAETLATATTGTLGFAPEASALSLPGSFAINGFGLAAVNYTLTQAPGNASAMTIVPPTPPEATNEVAIVMGSLRPDPLPMLTPVRDVSATRTLDALQGLRTDNQWGSAFGSIDVDAYSRDALAVLLESRDVYKRSLFDKAMKRLEDNPALADLPPCQSEDEVETGRCLVTEALIAQSGSGTAVSTPTGPLALPAPPAPATPPAAPAPAPAPSVAVAPPVPAAPPPPAARPAAAPPASAPAASIAVTVVRPKTVALAKAPQIPSARLVRSAALPQIQRKLAVLIGLDNYVDDRIPLLENAGRDVEAMARVLETRLGYQTVVVRDASREAIVGVLNRLALTARPNDSVVVYYAGHGTVVDGTGLGYWIPASADAERPESWISNSDIGKLVGSIRASQVALISDSCFSGSLVSDRRVVAFERSTDPGALLQRRAAVVMSSGGNEPVADGARNGHSPFASSLMQSLSQLDNWRPGNMVFEQIRQDVTRRLPQTPQYGAARQGRHAQGADYVFEQRQLEQAQR